MKKLARILSLLSLGMGSLSYYRLRSSGLDASIIIYVLKVLAGAFAPILAVLGLTGAALGILTKAPLIVISGGLGAWLSARYVGRVIEPHDGFERAFGADWRDKITPVQATAMLRQRWTWRAPVPPKPRFDQDIPFWTIPPSAPHGTGDTGRQLLCDIWQPGPGVAPSQLAFVYMHPGGWQQLDKDTGTRPLFSYLAAQGHVVMDVSYRLCHEADLFGMVGDVKRAVAWIKANADKYGVDPEQVVVAGGSAGGHLALLAAYTPNHPQLDPEDVRRTNTSVRAVVSYYGVSDLRRIGKEPAKPSSKAFVEIGKRTGYVTVNEYLEWPDVMRKMLGGRPHEVPEVAALMSPINHVGPHNPPTLLVHGTHDRVIPVEDARDLYHALSGAGVPTVYVELPQVAHAFDMVALRMSPPAQAALYDVERFLALMANQTYDLDQL